MSGFEAVAADIRSGAADMDAAASGVKGADPSGSVDDVGTAMPDSLSAGAARKLAATWRTRFATWQSDAETHADSLRASAKAYDESDYRADVEQRILMRRTGADL